MHDILTKIVESRLQDVAAKTVPVSELQSRHKDRSDFRPFRKKLNSAAHPDFTPAIIAEIKRGSPAKGLFAPNLDPVPTAQEYEAGGAACLSVLAEPKFFYGSLGDLTNARSHCSLPVLQKDFIVTEYQIYEAALYADAVLLIARCLGRSQVNELHHLATELGLDVLVEVYDEADIERIADFHFPLVGINHRNLDTMQIDLGTSGKLAEHFTAEQTLVAASGVKSRSDVERLMSAGFRNFLIGESLATATNRIEFLQKLIGKPC
jgi:indole-3-glycerol phosphate synthase